VDDQAHLENRRILDLIHQIEAHAIRLKNDPPHGPGFAMLDAAAPEFNLPMCRSLYRSPRNPVLGLEAIEAGAAELNLAGLFAQTAVDEKLLRARGCRTGPYSAAGRPRTAARDRWIDCPYIGPIVYMPPDTSRASMC